MCECGVVPVVRRLMRKGVPVSCAVAYMLASPVVNPVAIASTAVAFRGRDAWAVVSLRVGLAIVVATVVAAVVWRLLGEQKVLLGDCGADDDNHAPGQAPRGSLPLAILTTAAEDFLQIGATLVVGAALAALINSSFSRSAMEPLAANPWAAVTGMQVLAVALNLCSEADAFVASSFYAFPLPAKLAFLVLGPMVDLKLLAMYATMFRLRAIVAISGTTTLLVWILCATGYFWMPALGIALGR